MGGIQVGGAFNHIGRNTYGVQLGGFGNVVGENAYGVQIAGLLNVAGVTEDRTDDGAKPFLIQLGMANNVVTSFSGLQVGILNLQGQTVPVPTGRTDGGMQEMISIHFPQSTMNGLQVGAMVNSGKRVHGGQIGLFNGAARVEGFQIGFLNFTESLAGVQIGFVNIATANAWPFMLGVLVGFGGAST